MNTIFSVLDKVYDARYGWGVICKIDDHSPYFPIKAVFKNEKNTMTTSYTLDGYSSHDELLPTLSLTQYDYIKGGFSQERPEVLPERGTVVWVRDEDEDKWLIAHFMCKKENGYKANALDPFDDNTGSYWKQMTTKNPYTNEN